MGKWRELTFEEMDMSFDFTMIERLEEAIIKYGEDESRYIDDFQVDENSEYNPIQDMRTSYEEVMSALYASLAVAIVAKTEINVKKLAIALAEELHVKAPYKQDKGKSMLDTYIEFIKNNTKNEEDQIDQNCYDKHNILREFVNRYKHDTRCVDQDLISKYPSYFTDADKNKEIQYHKIIKHEDISNAWRLLRSIANIIYGGKK